MTRKKDDNSIIVEIFNLVWKYLYTKFYLFVQEYLTECVLENNNVNVHRKYKCNVHTEWK